MQTQNTAALKKRLEKCADYEIDVRMHALHFRFLSEQINEQDVLERLNRLKKLDFKELCRCVPENRDKFKLYFRHSKNTYHKYVIDVSDYEKRIRLVTIHRIDENLQKRFERYARR